MKDKKRLHFGIIFSTMDNRNQYDIWNGIVEYASKNDISLTAYFGTYQMTVNDFASHFETCLETIKNCDSLDGIIMLSGFIAHIAGNENFEKYAARIPERLPIVSVSYVMPGVPSVIVDNIAGMYGAVSHLIQVHGKKKIAFVKGPEGHPEAEDRLEGYKTALAANGIQYDERYIFPGHFDQAGGVNAVKKILENPEISPDAIVASNDVSAKGVLNELKNYNISVPDDIAVAGFDDDKFAAAFIPSISTARQDFHKMGAVSAEKLFDRIMGNPVEDITYVYPVFVARESCGCPDKNLSDFDKENKERKLKEIAINDNRWLVRRVAGNLVLIFDIDSLAEELYKLLPDISINTAIIGLYRNPVKSSDPNDDRTINTLIGFSGDKKFNIKNNDGDPILFSDYSSIRGFDFEGERRDLLFIPLFCKDEELGIMLMLFDPEISVDTYETLRVNISAAVRGAELVKEVNHQNDLLKSALKQANEASRAKSNFLSSMSHEMRTPMNAIIGMTTIGKKSKGADEKDHALDKIGDASSHLLGVINDILDMSKIEAEKLELAPIEFNFERMIQRVIAFVNFRVEEKEHKLSVKIDKNIPQFVIGDDQRLAQVITNLMSNAVKFTPMGGRIYLEASLIGKTGEICELRVSVKDSGIGISPDQQNRLFEAFEQAESGKSREYGGTGLGLVIAKRIVELMDGEIWIESELGKGAKFIFTVKVRRGTHNSAYLLAPDVNWGNVRILAVDDTLEIRDQFQDIFNGLNVRCDVAADAHEACRILEENGGYDIYFIDWQMPGMDGIGLTRYIRSRESGSPSVVIMITALDWEQIKNDAADAGVNRHLLKPLFNSTVIDCVNECFGKGRAPAEEEEAKHIKDEFAGKKMLLAEDIEINRDIIISLLSDTGLDIDCAENGQEALEMVQSARYDIVFMDVQMPKMDGYEATRAIRALPGMQSSLPIIAMTANAFKSDIEDSLAAGMDEHLRKPIDFDKVLKVLRKYL